MTNIVTGKAKMNMGVNMTRGVTGEGTEHMILNTAQDVIWPAIGNIPTIRTHDLAKNVTAMNGSNLVDTVPAPILLESGVLVVAAFTATSLIFSIVSLSKCTRLSSQMKSLSYNALLSDVIMHANTTVAIVCFFVFGNVFRDVVFFPLMISTMILLLISLASVAGLTLERLIALTRPISYNSILSDRKVALMSSHIWFTHSALCIAAVVLSAWKTCNWDLVSPSCDVWYFYLPFRLVSITFFLIYHPFIIFSYLKITKSIRHQMRIRSGLSIARDTEVHRLTRTIIRIVLAFEIIYFPIFVKIVVATIVPYVLRAEIFRILLGISYLCACSNSYFSIYTYVWKIKECRLKFLETFFSWSKPSRRNAAVLKSEVYNIIMTEKQSQSQ